jgi:hypothetical protein
MEYEETYKGQRIVITTSQLGEGEWTAQAILLDSGGRTPIPSSIEQRYRSEYEAKQAALSAAAGAIDRARISIGKP